MSDFQTATQSRFIMIPIELGVPSNSADLIGVALGELTHGLGRALLPNVQFAINLMTFGTDGQRDLNNADARYVSYDGGKTHIASLDTTSDPSDLAKGSPANDPFDAYQAPGVGFCFNKQRHGYHGNARLPCEHPIRSAVHRELARQYKSRTR